MLGKSTNLPYKGIVYIGVSGSKRWVRIAFEDSMRFRKCSLMRVHVRTSIMGSWRRICSRSSVVERTALHADLSLGWMVLFVVIGCNFASSLDVVVDAL